MNRFEWGVKYNNDQIAVSFPSCGMGLVKFNYGRNGIGSRVCCLMSGTTIVIPDEKSTTLSQSEEALIHCPHFDLGDIFEDSINFVQGFAAGNIRPRTWGNKSSITTKNMPIPCFFQAWPGGVIECYTFTGPNDRSMENNRYRELCGELYSNGAMQDILQLLSLDYDHLGAESLLRKAAEEYKLIKQKDDNAINQVLKGDIKGFDMIKLLFESLIKGEKISE